jgi:hypothetical protein
MLHPRHRPWHNFVVRRDKSLPELVSDSGPLAPQRWLSLVPKSEQIAETSQRGLGFA